MAQKRASLLERQQRRAEEARRRKQWQEAEKEQKREEAARLAQEEAPGLALSAPVAPAAPVATLAPATRAMAPAEEEVGPRRGDFTRLEYERRAQLKLMDDLDKVLRPRASGTGGPGRGGRRATRPRSGCCDDSALARSPARGLLGEDPERRGPMVVEKRERLLGCSDGAGIWSGQDLQGGEGTFRPWLDSEEPPWMCEDATTQCSLPCRYVDRTMTLRARFVWSR